MQVRLLKILYSNDLIKNSFILLSGTVIAQLFVFAAYPFMSRLFNPADFGLFALYVNIVNVLHVVSTGRYDIAIMLPKLHKDSKSLLSASLFFGVIFTALMYIVLLFFHIKIIALFNNPSLSEWIWLVPISIYALCVFQVSNYWLLRNKEFKTSSKLKIVQTLSIAIVSLILGIISIKAGLIIGYFLGNALMVIYCLYIFHKTGVFKESLSFHRMRANMKRYKEFPYYNLLPTLANTASASIPIFYISSFYGEQIVGYVNLAKQIISIPASFVSNSFSQVYFERLIKTKNEGKRIFKDLMKIVKVLSILALIFCIVISSTAFWAFQYIFGEKWVDAGIYASIMVLSVSIQFVISPIGIICPALDKIKIGSFWQLFLFIIICSLYFAKGLDPISFFLVYIGVESMAYLIYFAIIIKVAKDYDKNI
jgi:O-antigen/teichoic acid export membrane protein